MQAPRGGAVWLIVAMVLVVLAGAAAITFLIVTAGNDETTAEPVIEVGVLATTTTANESIAAPDAPTTTVRDGVPVVLPVVSATASSIRAPVTVGCTGDLADYEPVNAVDGDPDTGWATTPGDGVGETLILDLGETHELTSVGLTPGYVKVVETYFLDCARESRFNYNRIIDRVRWSFDDGTSVIQVFERDPRLQTIGVEAETRHVTLEILETHLPTGPYVDDDTIISQVEITGFPP